MSVFTSLVEDKREREKYTLPVLLFSYVAVAVCVFVCGCVGVWVGVHGACVRACVSACVRTYVRACVCVGVFVHDLILILLLTSSTADWVLLFFAVVCVFVFSLCVCF